MSHNSEIQSNLGIREDFHEETVLEWRPEGCLGKGEESLRPGENISSRALRWCGVVHKLKERQSDRTSKSPGGSWCEKRLGSRRLWNPQGYVAFLGESQSKASELLTTFFHK